MFLKIQFKSMKVTNKCNLFLWHLINNGTFNKVSHWVKLSLNSVNNYTKRITVGANQFIF